MDTKSNSSTENTNAKGTDRLKRSITPESVTLSRFTKGQLVQSAKYAANRDLLNALLEEEKTYSYAETEHIIQEFNQKGGI